MIEEELLDYSGCDYSFQAQDRMWYGDAASQGEDLGIPPPPPLFDFPCTSCTAQSANDFETILQSAKTQVGFPIENIVTWKRLQN